MRLYHWHGVLQETWAGDVVVLASGLEQARELAKYRVREHYQVKLWSISEEEDLEECEAYLSDIETIELVSPIVYDSPIALPFAGG